MNFLTQQQELAAQLGMDQTDSDTATLLKRWLNTSQQTIMQAAEWPFLRNSSPLIVQTTADVTTGTVATTVNSATITFSSGPAASVAGYYIQTSSSKDWYKITAHTAASTTATISPAAIYAVTAGTFIVRKFYYSVGTATVDRILQIRQAITPYQLREMDKEGFDKMMPNPSDVGTPLIYVMAGKDTSDFWQFVLWPSPNITSNMFVDYLVAATDLSADADVSIIPAKWHTSVMLEGAKWQGYTFLDDTRTDATRQNFFNGIEAMKQEMMPSRSQSRVIRPADWADPLFPFPLPAEYGMQGRSNYP